MGLVLCTWLAFRPVLDQHVDFLNFDDDRYVYDNAHVMQGLTPDSISWAFTSLEYDNWHPLTWLSHMLDRALFGPEKPLFPWGCHLINIVIHAINVLVLFLALCEMTSAPWPSLLVALLFGIHPLRAESVAWISERKDVLSGLFFLLTLWAYASYANRGRSLAKYGLVIVLFALGLLAKPMLVTLPLLLLLLDYWPLRRTEFIPSPGLTSGDGMPIQLNLRTGVLRRNDRPSLSWLLWEKAPLAALALASATVTVIAQQGAMLVIDTITIPMRMENALVSYATYIGEIFYPVNLAPLYPFPEHGIPWPTIAVSFLVLLAITALAARLRSWPWLAVGWLWYLVTVTPVIGLVQVGVQAMADRYTYLPHIGLYIMLAWSLEALTAKLPFRRWAWAAALAALAVVLVRASAEQSAHWTDNKTFWTAALNANPKIATAENNLGYIFEHDEGNFDEAFKRFKHAVEIRPRYVEARINLGNSYMHKGQIDEAMKHYRAAIEVRPDYDLGYANLGAALIFGGNLPEAEANFRKAIKINPTGDNFWKLGEVLYRQKKYDDAIECYTTLLQLPATAGKATELLGYLYYLKRQPRQALEFWTRGLGSQPDSLSMLTMTAWLLATDPDSAIRDGGRAVELAVRATKLSQGKKPPVLVALAAAYAETGDFVLAAQTIEQARKMPDKPLPDAVMIQLQQIYQSGKPYYDGNAWVIMSSGQEK
jgi:protein O-mannosyl-transferase